MSHFSISRRGFVVGCSAAIAALAGSRLNLVAFGNPEGDAQEMLLVIFLRGGCDGLNLVAPLDGVDRGHYEAARPTLKLPTNVALPLGTMPGATGQFGLHPTAAPLHELYQEGRLAIVHAAGLNHDTRSHFDAMRFMESGLGQEGGMTMGWLARHLDSAPPDPTDGRFPALAVSAKPPLSLLGNRDAIGMVSVTGFALAGHASYLSAQRGILRRMYGGSSGLHEAGLQTLDALDEVDQHRGPYTPANGAEYPATGLGNHLKLVAQVIKRRLGLRVATVDLGGWDTHEGQGVTSPSYPFPALVGQLSQGLHALYTDLNGAGSEDYTRRLTVVVMSEFGRRVRQNGSGGTDHGHGNVMLVLGGNVIGGLHGTWPGLANEQLYQATDLAITTDYRRILSEILIRRLGNPNLGAIFPQYSGYSPLGIVHGPDLPPITPTATATATATPSATATASATPAPGTPTPTPTPPRSTLYLPAILR